MTKYQDMILTALQDGARLYSTEGKNYKCWLVYSDGKRQDIRRKSAEIVCEKYGDSLVFDEGQGIGWKTKVYSDIGINIANHRSPFGIWS